MSGSLTSGGEMSNAELLQQVALWQWLNSPSDEGPRQCLNSQQDGQRGALAAVTGARVASELYNRLTGQNQINAFKKECIVGMAEFIRQNPRASEEQLNSELEKRVLLFAARVQALNQQPLL